MATPREIVNDLRAKGRSMRATRTGLPAAREEALAVGFERGASALAEALDEIERLRARVESLTAGRLRATDGEVGRE